MKERKQVMTVLPSIPKRSPVLLPTLHLLFVIQEFPWNKKKERKSKTLTISVNINVQIYVYYLKEHSCSLTASLSTSCQIPFSLSYKKGKKILLPVWSSPFQRHWDDKVRCSSLGLQQFIPSLERCRGETAAQGGLYTTSILQILLEKQEQLGKAEVCSSEPEEVLSVHMEGGKRVVDWLSSQYLTQTTSRQMFSEPPWDWTL